MFPQYLAPSAQKTNSQKITDRNVKGNTPILVYSNEKLWGHTSWNTTADCILPFHTEWYVVRHA